MLPSPSTPPAISARTRTRSRSSEPHSNTLARVQAGFGNWWDGQFLLPNVVLDLHLYDCFGEASQRSLSEHLDQVRRE